MRFYWPTFAETNIYYYDSPEEQLLIRMFDAGQIDIEFKFLGVDGKWAYFETRRLEHPRPRLVYSKPV
jgi:hypothetical protein